MTELSDRLQQTLGSGYRVIKELGGGGMSRVFSAEETELERPVVVKVLPPDLGAGLNVERFRREIQLAAKLQHPHIVPLLSAGAKDGLLYYTMPLIDGDTLRVKLSKSGEMPVPEAIRVLRDVADALEYAHGQGVVHRDIKPENVLLSGHHGLVTDFGVSKALANATGQQSLTSMGVALGTPAYMSPEQATADPNVDHRTDIYALGVVGYELMAGRPPFSGHTPQQVLAAQVTEAPVDVRKHRPNMPGGLAALIMRCLEKKPADRFQSAQEVRLQLESLATPSGGTQPYQATTSGRLTSESLGVRSHRSLAIIAAAVVIVVGAVIAARSMVGGDPGVPFAVGTARQLTNDRGIEITPALSPDGKLLAYAAGTAYLTRIYVRQVAGGDPVEVAASLPGNQRGPMWSADGTQIAFAGEAGAYAVPALGGVPRLLVNGVVASPTWSHDGKFLAYGRVVGVFLSDADGSHERQLNTAEAPHSIVWSPDDSRLAYVVGNATFVYARNQFGNISPTTLWTSKPDGTDAHAVTDALHMHFSPMWTPGGRGLLYLSNEAGGEDVYYQPLSRGAEADGQPTRVTTGLNIHGMTLSADASKLAYSVTATNVGIWAIPVSTGEISVSKAHAITSSNERIEDPALSPDGKWIAFDSDRSGTAHIYRVPFTGGAVEQITSGTENEFNPHWSRDGAMLSYQSWANGTRDSYVTPVASYSPRLVMGGKNSHEYAGIWSADGRALVVGSNRTGRYELFRVPATGGSPTQLTTTGGAPRSAISPDGKWIVWPLNEHLWLMPYEGGTPSAIPWRAPVDSATLGAVEWAADSKGIYVRLQDRTGAMHIAAVNLDGSGSRVVVRFDDPNLSAYRGEFSNDGRNFVFTIGRHEADIWVMDLTRK